MLSQASVKKLPSSPAEGSFGATPICAARGPDVAVAARSTRAGSVPRRPETASVATTHPATSVAATPLRTELGAA